MSGTNLLQSLFQERRARLPQETRKQKIERIFSIFWDNRTFEPFKDKLKQIEKEFIENDTFTADQVGDYVNLVYNAKQFISYEKWYENYFISQDEFIDKMYAIANAYIDDNAERRQLLIQTDRLKKLGKIDRNEIKNAYIQVRETGSMDSILKLIQTIQIKNNSSSLPTSASLSAPLPVLGKRGREEFGEEEEDESAKAPGLEEEEEEEEVIIDYEALDSEMMDEYARLLAEHEGEAEEGEVEEGNDLIDRAFAFCFY